jgi:hypothetical protein
MMFMRRIVSITKPRREMRHFYIQMSLFEQQSKKQEEDLSEAQLKTIAQEFEQTGVIDGGRMELPSPGQSSGDKEFDESVRAWRLANTVEDVNLQKIYKKQQTKEVTGKQKVIQQQTSYEEEDDDYDDVTAILSGEERKEFVCEYNPETGEHGGPTGKEPTRYGDWERKGRVSDF